MPFQADNIELSKVAPQSTGVPADYVDPNHPYFPHDSEAQAPPHSFLKPRACLSKKWLMIIFGVILALGLVIASLLIGIKIGISKCPGTEVVVYETTVVTSTSTGGTVRITPDPTIIITTLHTTPGATPTGTVPFKAPLRPTSVDPPQETCTSKGSWPTIEACQGDCDAPGKRAVCGVWTGGFTCVICPLPDSRAFFSVA
jgi:hypothetical protein